MSTATDTPRNPLKLDVRNICRELRIEIEAFMSAESKPIHTELNTEMEKSSDKRRLRLSRQPLGESGSVEWRSSDRGGPGLPARQQG